jgi:hypothetical protein
VNLPAGIEERLREIVREELAGQRPAGGGDGMSLDGGQRLGADGSVTYDFAGHVHALGLDLDLDTDLGVNNKITWSGGTTPGRQVLLDGISNGALLELLIGVSDDAIGAGELRIGANELRATIIDNLNAVLADKRIMHADGSSDFLQIASTHTSRAFWGQVVGATGAIARDGSGGWSAARTGVGTYVITYAAALAGQAPIPTVAPITTAQGYRVTALSGAAFTVVLLTAAGAAVDSDFGFIAIGRP